ncbi:30S ribosomal protein S20 [Candidatus Babeliales bacterium]|nr:30S ribosomal protein S20 [Candidatus Babeliales bacterium]
MANIKSAKKRALTNEKKRKQNVARRTALKTTARKIADALANNSVSEARELFKQAESSIARAAGKGVLKKNTASRKISRLAKKIAAAERTPAVA